MRTKEDLKLTKWITKDLVSDKDFLAHFNLEHFEDGLKSAKEALKATKKLYKKGLSNMNKYDVKDAKLIIKHYKTLIKAKKRLEVK